MSEPSEPEVSWKAIERDAAVVSSDGKQVARVVEVTGDAEADIFNGLVLRLGTLRPDRYLPAERVTRIWPHRVEVGATAAEVEALPAHVEHVAGRIVADEGGLGGRLRRLFRGR